MADNNQENKSQTQEVKEKKNSLTFDDQVIKKIAGIAVVEIPGILGLSGSLISDIADRFRSGTDVTKGVDAEVGTKQVALDLDVICEYGQNIPEVFDKAVNTVTETMKKMTGLEVVEFNMHVDDVMSKKDYDNRQNPNKSNDSDKSAKNNDRVQ